MGENITRRLDNDEILERICRDVSFVLVEEIYNDQIIIIISNVILDIQSENQGLFTDKDGLFNLLNSKKEALVDLIIRHNNILDDDEIIEDLYILLTSKMN